MTATFVKNKTLPRGTQWTHLFPHTLELGSDFNSKRHRVKGCSKEIFTRAGSIKLDCSSIIRNRNVTRTREKHVGFILGEHPKDWFAIISVDDTDETFRIDSSGGFDNGLHYNRRPLCKRSIFHGLRDRQDSFI